MLIEHCSQNENVIHHLCFPAIAICSESKTVDWETAVIGTLKNYFTINDRI